MTLHEIKNAIESLSEEERSELNAWLQGWTEDEWDEQMRNDARSGKFDSMVREAGDALRRGESRPFP